MGNLNDARRRAAEYAKKPSKMDLVGKSLRREWYRVDEHDVFFCPPLSIGEIREHFEGFRKADIEVKP